MVTYLDRVCISKLAPDIMRDLGLSKIQMGYVFSSFTLAYALLRDPDGVVGGPEGTRRVLTRIVIWWSGFTIATAAAFNYATLLVAAVPVRGGRGGRVAVRGAHVQPVDSGPRAGHHPGHLLCRRPPGGRAHAARGRRPPAVSAVARDLRLLRPGGIRLGRGLAYLVPQRSLGASRRQCRGARDASSPNVRRTVRTSQAGRTGESSCGIRASWPCA